MSALKTYSSAQVVEWVSGLGLASQSMIFAQNRIDGTALIELSREDLQELGLNPLPAKMIIRSVQKKMECDKQLEQQIINVITSPGGVKMAAAPALVVAAPLPTTISITPNMNLRDPVMYKMNDAFGYETRIQGFETQMVSIDSGPTHAIQSEPGAMIYTTTGVNFETKTDGKGFQRWVTGQRIFLTEWMYDGTPGTFGTVALSANFPSRIIPVNLQQHGGWIMWVA